MPYKNKSDKVLSDRKHQQRRRLKLSYTLKGVLGGKCIRCFSSKNLEFHHKIPILRHSTNQHHLTCLQVAYRDYNNDTSSLILLCKDCHKEWHKIYDK